MNIDKIFNMFEPKVKPTPENIVLIDLYDHPYYWVSMFKKIMTNHRLFSEKFIILCSNLDPTLSPEDLTNAGEYFAYERAWFYIQKLDITVPLHKQSLEIATDNTLLNNLSLILLHFQNNEEYENCAFIYQIIKEVKKILL
jgi:hypothetical protein